MDDVMPRPVTTTRRMAELSLSGSRGHAVREHPDAHVLAFIGRLAIDKHGAVGDGDAELAHQQLLDVDLEGDLLGGGGDHVGEFHFADADRAALDGRILPAEDKADQLPPGYTPDSGGASGTESVG